jgi:hypothetical protein
MSLKNTPLDIRLAKYFSSKLGLEVPIPKQHTIGANKQINRMRLRNYPKQ